jgi:hypothetical protein
MVWSNELSAQLTGGEDKTRMLVWNGRESVVRKAGTWKGAAVQTGLEHGSRGIPIVRSRYQETSNEDTTGWKNLVCTVVKC